MYPRRDIDKARERGETLAVDPELRDALDRLAADLRGEIRSGDAETRAYVNQLAEDLRGEIRSGDAETRAYVNQLAEDLRGEIRSGDAETRAYIDERVGTSTAETRRHFDVVGESLRGEIRALAEAMALNTEGTQRQVGEQAARTDRLEGRVLRLETRVTILEGSRKPPKRPRRP